jgi:Mg-chelatase subunit ChlD
MDQSTHKSNMLNAQLFQIQEGVACLLLSATATEAAATAATEATAAATAATAISPNNTHTIFLIDRSGSMSEGGKLLSVQQTLESLLGMMTDGDEFSLISFESEAHVELSRIAMTADNRDIVRSRIRSLKADGSTNMVAALSYVNDVVYPANATHLKQGVLLLTDGHSNIGTTEDLLRRLQGLRATYPSLSFATVGYGTNHNATLLGSMATEGAGSYNVVRGLEDVATVFGDVFGGLKTVAYEQVRLSVPPHVRQRSVYATHALPDGRSDIFVGDLQAGTTSSVCVVLEGLTAADRLDVRATDVTTGLPVTLAPVFTAEVSEDNLVQGRLAFTKARVVAFMNDVNTFITGPGGTPQQTVLTGRATALRAEVTALHASPLRDLLLRELQRCEMYLATGVLSPPRLTHRRSNELSQHAATIGLGRGILSSRHGEDPEDEDEDEDEDPNISVFSNSYQRSTSEGLRNTTTTPQQVQPLTPFPFLNVTQHPVAPPRTPTMTRSTSNPF